MTPAGVLSSFSKKVLWRAAQAARYAEEVLAQTQGEQVLRFWGAVLELYRQHGVCLDDCRGFNMKVGHPRRSVAKYDLEVMFFFSFGMVFPFFWVVAYMISTFFICLQSSYDHLQASFCHGLYTSSIPYFSCHIHLSAVILSSL